MLARSNAMSCHHYAFFVRASLQSLPQPLTSLSSHPHNILLPTRILLHILLRLFLKPLPIILKHLRRARLQRIIRVRLHQQTLRRQQNIQDLAAWFPGFRFEDADAHASFFVKGDVGVPDAGYEVDGGRFEGVFFGEDEEELEFPALRMY
jgi:hypothetical protein